ncbi:MAG: hemolysin [Crocinitomicaceae bacterium]|nr:hemolysin [Crocinitomicaceae bacterium]
MEIAFISANRIKIELDNKKGDIRGRILAYFSNQPSWFIGAMLLGNNIALVVYSIYMEELINLDFINKDLSPTLVLLIQTLISTLFILVFAEFLPKAIFRINPNGVLSVFTIPLILIYIILWLPTAGIVSLSRMMLYLFGKKHNPKQNVGFEKIDLDHYLDELRTDLDDDEELEHDVKIFHNALGFSEIIARDCMVPRNEIIAFEIDDCINDLKEKFIETGFSKILIYKESIDHIIGYVHSIELFKQPEHIKSILLPVNIVPESINANKILEEFITKSRSIAVVVDEFGGTSGMVTMEDVIEEIFGEIDDEHDQEDFIHQQISNNEFVFSSRLEIDFVNEKYRLGLPESEEYETLGGLVIHYSESIPKKGETFIIEGFKLVIAEVTEFKILKIKLSVIDNEK